MRPAEVVLFRGIVNTDEFDRGEQPDMAQVVRSHWPVSVVKRKEDLESYILTNLVENYAHLNVAESPREENSEGTDYGFKTSSGTQVLANGESSGSSRSAGAELRQ